jgi:uncharacterized membrane protein YgcG
MLITGLLLAVFGLLLSWLYAPIAFAAQLPLAIGVGWLGVRKGGSKQFLRSARGATKRTGWIMGTTTTGSSSGGSSGSSSGSSGSSFGGGRSGGGGASGSW